MPLMYTPEAFATVTGAAADGTINVEDTEPFFPGAKAWLHNVSTEARARILILQIEDDTTLIARRFKDDNEFGPPHSYGRSDFSDWNADSTISQEAQMAPYEPAGTKRSVP